MCEGRGDLDLGDVLVLGGVLLHQVAEDRQVLRGDGLTDLVGELGQALVVHGVNARQVHVLNGLAGGLFDGTQQVLFARGHEEDRVARAACTAGAADAVDVGLGVVRDIEVDHVGHSLNVKATGRDVGGDQDVDLAIAKVLDGALALLLRDVTVDGCSGEAAGLELVGQVLGCHLGAHEGDNAFGLLRSRGCGSWRRACGLP